MPAFKTLHIKRGTPMQELEKVAKKQGTTAAKLIEEVNKANEELAGSGTNKYFIIGGVAVFLIILIILIIRIKRKKK